MRFLLPFKIFWNLIFKEGKFIVAINDYKKFKRLCKKKGDHIFIACFAKSGSTFLSRLLSEITGYGRFYYTDFRGRSDHDIYLPALLNVYEKNVIVQQHARATEMNLDYLNYDSKKAIVLVRNIFDALVSYRDHIINETHVVPFIYCREDFKHFSFDKQMDMVIENVAPWYINFYVSWAEAIREKKIAAILTTYEELTSDPMRVVNTILTHYNLTFSDSVIDEKIKMLDSEKKTVRFNQGIVGRGQQINDTLKNKVYSMIKYYPDIDFKPIGL
jgi:hypothetical protein